MSIITRQARRLAATAAALAVVTGVLITGSASSASALTSIQAPSGFSCDASRAQLVVPAPRAWSSYNTPELTAWASQIERWNSTNGTWYLYDTVTNWAQFTNQGRAPLGWSVQNNIRGGQFVNNYMRYTVSHHGYYRIRSVIVGSVGVTWSGYLAGGGYCAI